MGCCRRGEDGRAARVEWSKQSATVRATDQPRRDDSAHSTQLMHRRVMAEAENSKHRMGWDQNPTRPAAEAISAPANQST